MSAFPSSRTHEYFLAAADVWGLYFAGALGSRSRDAALVELRARLLRPRGE